MVNALFVCLIVQITVTSRDRVAYFHFISVRGHNAVIFGIAANRAITNVSRGIFTHVHIMRFNRGMLWVELAAYTLIPML
jgi:hypothetical protein